LKVTGRYAVGLELVDDRMAETAVSQVLGWAARYIVPAPPGAASSGTGDYGYKFEDDPLAAGGFGPSDATIRVRPGPVRTTLIRPRTSFVPEMLKSVENI